MKEWKPITGEQILYKSGSALESEFETVMVQSIAEASDGQCQMIKLYYTDGFGWYYDKQQHKIVFILHECKSIKEAGKTLRGYTGCLKRALLQNIGYYLQIQNRQIKSFTPEICNIAKEFGYDDVYQFVLDHFGLFLITSPRFVSYVVMTDELKQYIEDVNLILLHYPGVSPSKYKDIPELRKLRDNFDVSDCPITLMPGQVNLQDTGKIIELLLKE